jgi:hypothetical protein
MSDSQTLEILDEIDEWMDEDFNEVLSGSLNYADEFEK